MGRKYLLVQAMQDADLMNGGLGGCNHVLVLLMFHLSACRWAIDAQHCVKILQCLWISLAAICNSTLHPVNARFWKSLDLDI